MKLCPFVASLAAVAAMAAPQPTRFEKPRVAVIISHDSFKQDWATTQMSGHAWAGNANLAGLPYDTVFISDVADAAALQRYRALVFAQCFAVEEEEARRLEVALGAYLKSGGGVIVDGRLAVVDENGKPRNHSALDGLLGIEYPGLQGDTGFRVTVRDNRHFIVRQFDPGQYLNQFMAKGLNIIQFAGQAGTLLVSTDDKQSWPFLSAADRGPSRVGLFSDLTTLAGATSIFRNEAPQGFYANKLIDTAVRGLQWAVYGNVRGPIPAPQLVNANMAAIVRLDADLSPKLDYQQQTFRFLTETAEQTGVVSVYAWVSSGATKAGWEALAPLGRRLEEVGGQIGTHSKNHRIRNGMPEEQWKVELDGSVAEIESNLERVGTPLGKIEWLINPGDTISNLHYDQLARLFRMCMTHGFEQDTPIGFGNLTWYTGPEKNFVVLDDVPSPDYQWYYDPEWSYTTAQVTSYQEAILDHLFQGVGRGVVYNQMWHDYGICSMPVTQRALPAGAAPRPPRIKNTYLLPLYEAVRAKWASLPIYAPEPEDLVNKVLALAQWDYSWQAEESRVDLTLDMSGLRRDEIVQFTGGMGVRIDNTLDPIQSVTIDGVPHQAFSDHVVILPNLAKGIHKLSVTLGPLPSNATRLTYVSKRMPAVRQQADGLAVELLTKCKARMAFHTDAPAVLVGADFQEWNRKGNRQLDAWVTSDRTVILRKAPRTGFGILQASTRVLDFRETPSAVKLTLEGPGADSPLRFTARRTPKRILVNGKPVQAPDSDIMVPQTRGKVQLEVEF